MLCAGLGGQRRTPQLSGEAPVKWSWKIGRLAGIDVYIHATFLILLAWVAILHYQAGRTVAAAVAGLLYIAAVFGIVVLHELGHALTARRFGIGTRDITLLPIGGVARLERMPEDPRQELLVALAGPAVNVALALLLYALLVLSGGANQDVTSLFGAGGSPLSQLVGVNIWLAAFNLIPAFPMDGGRVLRAVLAMRRGYVRATEIAATVGKAFALLFGILGLFYVNNPFLVFIALFVWLGAAAEASAVQARSALEGVPLQRVMITDVRTLSPQEPLTRAVEHVLAGFQQDFPVVDRGELVGVLTRADLLKALAARGPSAPVAEVMQREFQTAEPSDELERVLARLRECGCHTLPVVRGRQLLGVLTMENIGEFLLVQSALRTRGATV